MPPPLVESDSSRSGTPDEFEDIPASIPPTQTRSDHEAEEQLKDELKADEKAEEQLEHELVETTEQKPMKKEKVSRKRKSEKPAEPDPPTNGDALDGEEYVVESILDHTFRGKKCYYRVRWEGWSEDDDTWEPEEHLLPDSKEILAKYHKKLGGTPQPLKAARKTASKANLKAEPSVPKDEAAAAAQPPTKRTKRTHHATSGVLEPGSTAWKQEAFSDYTPADKGSWEDLVHEVETVERDENGTLYAFIRFRNGKRSKVANNLYTSRCPRAMLRFYEGHLVWPPVGLIRRGSLVAKERVAEMLKTPWIFPGYSMFTYEFCDPTRQSMYRPTDIFQRRVGILRPWNNDLCTPQIRST